MTSVAKPDAYRRAGHQYPPHPEIPNRPQPIAKPIPTTLTLVDGWLPLPPALLSALGWAETQHLDIEVLPTDPPTLVLTQRP